MFSFGLGTIWAPGFPQVYPISTNKHSSSSWDFGGSGTPQWKAIASQQSLGEAGSEAETQLDKLDSSRRHLKPPLKKRLTDLRVTTLQSKIVEVQNQRKEWLCLRRTFEDLSARRRI